MSRHRVHGDADHGFSHPVLGESPKHVSWLSRCWLEWDGCDPFCHHVAKSKNLPVDPFDIDGPDVDDPLG